MSASNGAKLLCIFNYFDEIGKIFPVGGDWTAVRVPIAPLRFHLAKLLQAPDWQQSDAMFGPLSIMDEGSIEDCPEDGAHHVDFANKFIGGGVLGNGALQEEIRFVVSPELLISRLLLCGNSIEDDEVVFVDGSRMYSKITGYAQSLCYSGTTNALSQGDAIRPSVSRVIAMDAHHFGSRSRVDQYRPQWIERELNKAFLAFSATKDETNTMAIATGNWGIV